MESAKNDEKIRKGIVRYPSILIDENVRKNLENDLNIKKFIFSHVVNGIEDTVYRKEEQRDHKMKIDFEREKELFLTYKSEFKQKIEEISSNNLNERLINFLKEEKNNQLDLFNKYYTMNTEINFKIKKIKDSLPEYEEKVKKKKEKLKEKVNVENLRLMEKINQVENDRKHIDKGISFKIGDQSFDGKFIRTDELNTTKGIYEKRVNNRIENIKENLNNKSINITEIIDENHYLKDKYENSRKYKEKLKLMKKENKYLSTEISNMNYQYFYLSKIFIVGIHQLSNELLKVHELKLDKIVQSKIILMINKENLQGNSLYFELYKDKFIGNLTGSINLDDQMKLPMINNNIKEKYNFPIIEKTDPNTFIYNAIKNMLEENQNLNKSMVINKKKIEWEEFKKFSAYQIYTLISLNKV